MSGIIRQKIGQTKKRLSDYIIKFSQETTPQTKNKVIEKIQEALKVIKAAENEWNFIIQNLTDKFQENENKVYEEYIEKNPYTNIVEDAE